MKKPVKLGLYGCGNRTQALLNTLYGEDEYQVVALFDLRRESMQTVAEKYGGKPCQTAEELVACREADAFLISLDPLAHPDAFDLTVEAGKPIFIEKPIALSAERAYRMMRNAQAKNVPVHVGLMRRYGPEQIAARRYIADNPPGRLFGISCNWFHPGETEMINCLGKCPDNFRLKMSQIPFHCCHALDVMRTYAGEVKAVDARGIKWVERRYPSPDKVIALLEYTNGSVGSFHYSSMSYKSETRYIIHYENYTLSFENGLEIWHRPPHRSQREGDLLYRKTTDKNTAFFKKNMMLDCRPTYHPNIGPDQYKFAVRQQDVLIMTDFLTAVREGSPMKVTIEDGYKVAELAEAIETSWKSAKVITLPLKF